VFLYNASFTYENSLDNLPIENIWLLLPHPNILGKPVETGEFIWELLYLDENNLLRTQIQNGVVIQLLGDRTTSLIIQYDRSDTDYGPKFAIHIDTLYPHESVAIYVYVMIPAENADALTLRESRENQMVSVSCLYSPPSKKIDISFRSLLSKKVNDNFEKVEDFGRKIENAEPSGYWLYSTDNNSI
jgi:hypothetical protein